MSTEVEAVESGALVAAGGGAVEAHVEHHHPGPRQYVMIAVILVIITALEVAVSYLDRDTIGPNWIMVLLFSMAVIKFFLVVGWFMHLKTDKPILRRFFFVGLIGAPILFAVVVLALNAWTSDHNTPPTLLPESSGQVSTETNDTPTTVAEATETTAAEPAA